MADIFVVAWTGGYDPPSYIAKATESDAWKQAQEWAVDANDTDNIDVLRIDPDNLMIHCRTLST